MPIVEAVLICLALFAGMLVLFEVGFRVGMLPQKTPHGETEILDSAVFALLGLLLGFAFAGVVDRFGHRHQLIIDEANAIHSTYQHVDLLDVQDQPAARQLFKRYIEARLEVYAVLDAGGDPQPAWEEARKAQDQLWSAAVLALDREGVKSEVIEMFLPSLNLMFEVATERKVAVDIQMPELILGLLLTISLLSALIAGNGMAKSGARHTMHAVVYSLAVSLTIFTILDLDQPRSGVIRLDAADSVLKELRDAI